MSASSGGNLKHSKHTKKLIGCFRRQTLTLFKTLPVHKKMVVMFWTVAPKDEKSAKFHMAF